MAMVCSEIRDCAILCGDVENTWSFRKNATNKNPVERAPRPRRSRNDAFFEKLVIIVAPFCYNGPRRQYIDNIAGNNAMKSITMRRCSSHRSIKTKSRPIIRDYDCTYRLQPERPYSLGTRFTATFGLASQSEVLSVRMAREMEQRRYFRILLLKSTFCTLP